MRGGEMQPAQSSDTTGESRVDISSGERAYTAVHADHEQPCTVLNCLELKHRVVFVFSQHVWHYDKSLNLNK